MRVWAQMSVLFALDFNHGRIRILIPGDTCGTVVGCALNHNHSKCVGVSMTCNTCLNVKQLFPRSVASVCSHCCWTQIKNAAAFFSWWWSSCTLLSYRASQSVASYSGTSPHPNHTDYFNMCEYFWQGQPPVVCFMWEQANVNNILI